MRTIRYSVLALMLGATPAAMLIATAQAQVSVNIRVNSAPPPLPYYEQPAIPADGYLWVPGYWYWDRSVGDYYWVPGTWVEPPRRGLLWTPAYWSWVEGSYVFYPGYWAREVGFYGGIDYGYGYTGQGYLGGRWENGAFFYNRSVNNIENVRITKVYNQTVVMNSRSNNVSFNGGKGGIAARPTSQQVAFAKERHVEATPVQRQHVEKASKDRALFSKQNHGEPAVAATPRAGVFQGSGVSRGSHTPVATKSNNNVPSTGTEKSGTAVNKETPKVEEAHRPAHEQPKAEERRPVQEQSKAEARRPVQQQPKAEEQRRPVQEQPKAEARRPVQQQPKAEEQHRPVQEQPKAEERRPVQQQPRAEEQRRPVQEPRGNQAPQAPPQQPAAAQAPRPPALAGARPPAVGGQGGGQGSGQGGGGEKR
jgi:WXXGXW repeat (2 copies)